jgi:hypothetical protein
MVQAVPLSRRALGAHRMRLNAREPRRSTARVLFVTLGRERKLGPKGDGQRLPTAFLLRRARRAQKRHASALMTAGLTVTTSVRGRRRSIERAGSVNQESEQQLAPKVGGLSARAVARERATDRATPKGVNATMTGGVRMTSHVRMRRHRAESLLSVTLRRPRSGPRRATRRAEHPSGRAHGADLGMTVNVGLRRVRKLAQKGKVPSDALAVHLSKRAHITTKMRVNTLMTAHLRMAGNGNKRLQAPPSSPLRLSVPKDRRPARRPPCKTSPSPPTKLACGSIAFSKRIFRA